MSRWKDFRIVLFFLTTIASYELNPISDRPTICRGLIVTLLQEVKLFH